MVKYTSYSSKWFHDSLKVVISLLLYSSSAFILSVASFVLAPQKAIVSKTGKYKCGKRKFRPSSLTSVFALVFLCLGYSGDVWYPQPAPKDHPWRYMPNHAMTPHISGTTIDAQVPQVVIFPVSPSLVSFPNFIAAFFPHPFLPNHEKLEIVAVAIRGRSQGHAGEALQRRRVSSRELHC